MKKLRRNGDFYTINTKHNFNYFVTPLATDTHLHLLGFGEKLNNPDLEHKDNENIKKIIEEELLKDKKDIVLRGWSEQDCDLNKDILDDFKTAKNILLIRRCGHVAIANTNLLENLDFEESEKYVNRSNGYIYEKALEKIYEKIGYFTDINGAYEEAKNYLISKGYGFVHSEDIHGITVDDLPYDDEYLKVYEKIAVNSYDELLKYYERGYFKKYKAVKVYLDGSFGGWTAYMREVYKDRNTKGKFVWNKEELMKVLLFCEDKKLHLAMHAIGDASIDIILEIFEKINPIGLHRIIHSAILHDEQIKKLEKYNIILDMQPEFINSDKPILEKRLGLRTEKAYRFLDIYKSNIPLFLSSDAPVEIPDWIRDLKTLSDMGIPLKYLLHKVTYAPEVIDKIDREKDMHDRYLIFKDNPHEKITIPEIHI
ncbi:amidohydrolase family protein [Oceanotoga sp. DSM 15011]|uniref:amidohydrolase family protein n=1 Tax=Oceanotoga sp. DSM 15011 TaxID=2984951 RepID=UPI0021F427A1|nr:amidohydrolase family protein [Oceanotoga sp. DSM 15011]UYP01396.1 amidohydrolase family protein [Oceanotoga sp. DSM 15011]